MSDVTCVCGRRIHRGDELVCETCGCVVCSECEPFEAFDVLCKTLCEDCWHKEKP